MAGITKGVIQSSTAPGGATRCLRAIPSRAWDRKAKASRTRVGFYGGVGREVKL